MAIDAVDDQGKRCGHLDWEVGARFLMLYEREGLRALMNDVPILLHRRPVRFDAAIPRGAEQAREVQNENLELLRFGEKSQVR